MPFIEYSIYFVFYYSFNDTVKAIKKAKRFHTWLIVKLIIKKVLPVSSPYIY